MSEVFTEATALSSASRARLMAWLAEGGRSVTWALETLPRANWAVQPPAELGTWSALRHVRHLTLRESGVTLPSIRTMLGELDADRVPSSVDIEREDAAWDAPTAAEHADTLLAELAGVRFELLQALERAPEGHLKRIEWLLLVAHQHELEHLAALWRIALYWDSMSTSTAPTHGSTAIALHPADSPTPTPTQTQAQSEGVRPR